MDAFPTATSTPLLFNKPRFEISVQPLGTTLCTGITSAQRCPTVPSTQNVLHQPTKRQDRGSVFTIHTACCITHATLQRMSPPMHAPAVHSHYTAHYPHHQLVFLQGGSRFPTAHSRFHLSFKVGHLLHRGSRKDLLALAGDIETNPGPKCDSCGDTIRSNQMTTKVNCIHQDCDASTHRCPPSGISRYDPAPVWLCRHHRGDPPISEVTLALPPAPCDTCGKKFTQRQLKSKADCNQPGVILPW